jgi:hypothetical protein
LLSMRRSKSRVPTRTIAAVILIGASFVSAYVLSSMANRTQLLWSARNSLIPGIEISTNDLEATKASISDGSIAYISARRDVTHFRVLRAIGAGELVPASALSQDTNAVEMSSVPVSVRASDVPMDLQAGQAVNLYHVGDSHLSKDIGPPNLILAHAFILGIDRKGQNLGGDLALTISISRRSVLQVLDATASGRVVVVRVNG